MRYDVGGIENMLQRARLLGSAGIRLRVPALGTAVDPASGTAEIGEEEPAPEIEVPHGEHQRVELVLFWLDHVRQDLGPVGQAPSINRKVQDFEGLAVVAGCLLYPVRPIPFHLRARGERITEDGDALFHRRGPLGSEVEAGLQALRVSFENPEELDPAERHGGGARWSGGKALAEYGIKDNRAA